jgi:hypothetical protein
VELPRHPSQPRSRAAPRSGGLSAIRAKRAAPQSDETG